MVVLQIQSAYFQYVANRALLQAQRITQREARTNLPRPRSGTGSESQPSRMCSRPGPPHHRRARRCRPRKETCRLLGGPGAFAGLARQLPYDVDSAAGQVPVAMLADSVDTLIASAVKPGPTSPPRRPSSRRRGRRSRRPEPTGCRRWSLMEPEDGPTPPAPPGRQQLHGFARPQGSAVFRLFTDLR